MDTLELDKISIVSTNLMELREYFLKILANHGKSALIITLNLELYRNALSNIEFNTVCHNADLVIPDGIGVTHLIKLKYKKKINRITGNDVLEMILDISTHIPLRVAFVGSSEKVINDLSAKVTAFYPGCTIAAAISPALYFENNEKENNAVLEELEKGKPDVLFLALNYARGEIWLNKYRNQIGAKLNIGVGAAFDFFTGSKKRSPLFIQKLSLEWAWRLIQEPKRLYRRYLIQGLPLFIKKTIQIILKNDV